MTALDDALNSSTPVFESPTLHVDWKELPPQIGSTNSDSPRIMSGQLGDYTVEHSLDDGLPDPVTFTSGNDASGVVSAQLAGREGVYADQAGWRTSVTGTGTGTSVTPGIATGSTWDDYCLVAFTMNSTTPEPVEASGQWDLLATESDGATLITRVYGCRWYSSLTGPQLSWQGSTAYSWVSVAAYAQTADGSFKVQVVPDESNIVADPESVTGTSHAASPTVLDDRRGWFVGVWSSVSASANWTAPAGHTELGEAAATVDVMVSTSPLSYPSATSEVITATTGASTGIATKAVIPLRIMDRPRMSARRLFSPFSKYSPFFALERDTADTEFDFNVVTADGVVGTILHKGQMARIGVEGSEVSTSLVSKTRLDFQSTVVFPKVWGTVRESMTFDWVVTYAMSRAGQFVGPAPTRWAVYWNPMYGSARGMLEGYPTFGLTRLYELPDTVDVASRSHAVPGPYFLGMFYEQSNGRSLNCQIDFIPASQTLPHIAREYPDWEPGKQFTFGESAGRVSFWIRGDAATYPPPQGGGIRHFQYYMARFNAAGTMLASNSIQLNSQGRNITIFFDGEGWTFSPAGLLPTDGEWHFYAIRWNYLTRESEIMIDGNQYTPSPSNWVPADPSDLPLTMAAGVAASHKVQNQIVCNLPVSEIQVEFGIDAFNDGFTSIWPPATTPRSETAVLRASDVPMQGLFQSAPFQAWDVISEMARSSLSSYRVDESDSFNFFALPYFGESAQMTPVAVADTEVNASDLEVVVDPTKVRNSVTVKYQETRIDSTSTRVYVLTETMELPRGVTEVIFPLDAPIVEVWGEGLPGPVVAGSAWTLENATSNHASGVTSLPPSRHFFFVNTQSDGAGTYLTFNSVHARILRGDASTITVQFTNKTVKPVYVTNNGNEIPFLVLKGAAVRTQDAYVTLRDEGSIARRRERPVEVERLWIQTREVALEFANKLLTVLSNPKSELSITVMGDPRRKPGDLFTIDDSQGTEAQGTWRALSLTHEGGGPKFVQTMRMVQVNPVAVWDQSPGWDQSVWGE